MLYPAIENCVEKVGCKYALAAVVGRRVKDLSAKQSANKTVTKELSMALEEIADGKIVMTVHNTKI